MTARCAVLALILSFFAARAADGQQPSERTGDSASVSPSRIPGMVSTSHIKFVPHFGARVRGRDPMIIGDSLHVHVGRKSQVYALSSIDTVWVRRGTWARNLGLTTGAIGAALGATIGIAFSHDEGHHPSTGEEAGAAIVAGLIVGVIWAAPGAAIGRIFPRWERVYVRSGSSP